MKHFTKVYSSIFLVIGLVFALCSCEKSQKNKSQEKNSNFQFAGVWEYIDNDKKFETTLNPDGTAISTWDVLDKGKWKVVNQQKAHVLWNNGSNEFIIVDDRGGVQLLTFPPGQSTEGKPSITKKINKKNP